MVDRASQWLKNQKSLFLFLIPLMIPMAVFLMWLYGLPLGLVDDAYIPMVYAKNIASGHGIVFYPGGERVEGYTSPLWTLLLTLAESIRLPLPTTAYTLSVLAGLIVLLITVSLYQRTYHKNRQGGSFAVYFWSCAAGFTLVSDVAFAAWAASGMETAAYTALLLLLVYAMINEWRLSNVCGLVLLLSLTRPEGAAFLPLVLAIRFYRQRSISALVKPALLFFLAPYLLFISFRIFYFGYPFPNSFYAKHDFGGVELWSRGLWYVTTFFQPRYLLLFAVFGLLLEKPETRRGGVILSLFAVWHILLVIIEGGDHFTLHRFLVPALPILTIMAVRGVERCCDRIVMEKIDTAGWRMMAARIAIIILFPCLLAGYGAQLFDYKSNDNYHFSNGARWFLSEVSWARGWVRMGDWLREKYPPGTLIAVMTAGAIPYRSELPCIDILGINDTIIAHAPVRDRSRHYAGHEKSDADYLLRRKPRFIQLFPLLSFSSSPYPKERLEELLTYPAQWELWNHPRFRQEYQYKTEQTRYGYISYFERAAQPNE